MLIGVDWGGTKIEVIAMESDGTELIRLRRDTPRGDYQGCLTMVRDLIEEVESTLGRQGSIGIGIPGSLEPISRLGKGGSSTWINGQPVEADLQKIIARPIRVVNDADCYHGPNNSAGDWGHNPLPLAKADELPGDPCYCGKNGCIETWLSGYSFARDFQRHGGAELKPAEIVKLMRDGDQLAIENYQRWIDRVGRGLSVVVNTLDPDIFVMGGGMSNIDELYRDLPAKIAQYTFSPVFATPIVKSVHGDSSGVRGAAWLWRS